MAKPQANRKKVQEIISPEVAFGRILRNRRIALGLRQSDLEHHDFLDQSYISKLERGERQVCLRGILHLANVLQLTPGELIDEVARQAITQ